jgi:hypothetical protein
MAHVNDFGVDEKGALLAELHALQSRLSPPGEVNAAWWLLSALIAEVVLDLPDQAAADAEHAAQKIRRLRGRRVA